MRTSEIGFDATQNVELHTNVSRLHSIFLY